MTIAPGAFSFVPMPRPARDPSLLTTRQAAALLGVSHDTVSRMVDAGELPSTRTAGGHRRVPRAAVQALLDGEDHERAA